MTFMECAARGIERIRNVRTMGTHDHLKLDIKNRNSAVDEGVIYATIGPKVEFHSPGFPLMHAFVLEFRDKGRVWEPYTGPLPGSDEWFQLSSRVQT